MADIRTIEHGTKAYWDEVDLRFRVLREPLGLVFTQDQLAAEATDIHIVAIINGVVAGCLVLTPIDSSTVQMRQVAVDPGLHSQGIGRQLVACCERTAEQNGYREIMLHARDTAVPFYLKLGYELRGEEFIEVTIPHREMFKVIRP